MSLLTPDMAAALEGDCLSKRWVRAHLDHPDKDWCLIWPFSKHPQAYADFGGDKRSVHRFMCEYRNGPPPTPEHQAAHSCGRGHDGCVNPWHLDWKTAAENGLDRFRHSGPTPRAKLTPAQVDEIRALEGRAKIADIAEQFGVSQPNIRDILAGKLWKNTSTLQQRVFTEEEVLRIRTTPRRWGLNRAFAEEFGVSQTIIGNVRRGVTYKYFGNISPEPSHDRT